MIDKLFGDCWLKLWGLKKSKEEFVDNLKDGLYKKYDNDNKKMDQTKNVTMITNEGW